MFTKIVICSALVCSLFVVLIEAQLYLNGTILIQRDVEFECTKSGPQCASDCFSLLLCAGGINQALEVVNCGTASPATPYCQGNACSNDPGNCQSASRCTSAGIFPDPTNCSRYTSCDESMVGAAGNALECKEGYFFNSMLTICEKGKLHHHSKKCNTINCSGKENEIVVYPSNPSFYAFCFFDSETGSRETIMFKCESNDLIYDLKINDCTFNCKKPGTFQDPTNCYWYYVCSRSMGSLKAQRIKCAPNYYFDGEKCTLDDSKCSIEALAGADAEPFE